MFRFSLRGKVKGFTTKEIVEVYIGTHSCEGAQELWQFLPGVYRQCAVCYTDFWSAYWYFVHYYNLSLLVQDYLLIDVK